MDKWGGWSCQIIGRIGTSGFVAACFEELDVKVENADTTTIEPRESESESERRETVDGFRLHVHVPVELHVDLLPF